MNLYTHEVYPENIKYIKDSLEIRKILKLNFGDTRFDDSKFGRPQLSYIKFDMTDNTWKTSFDFEWLYRNSPPLTSIEEILKLKQT
jgi:hypothetical protein